MTRKPKTYVLLVVDRSGSMVYNASDVVGGLNAYMDDLRADDTVRYRVTLALFESGYEVAFADAKPKDIKKFTESWYNPRGLTALYHAIGRTITDFDACHPDLKPEDKVLLVVQTDGEENNSHRITGEDRKPLFNQKRIQDLLAAKQAQGWGCMYLGVGPEAWGNGPALGFGQQVNTVGGSQGIANTYTGLSLATRSYSKTGDVASAAAEIEKVAGVDNA